MQCQGYPGNPSPFMLYNYMGSSYPDNTAMWQQQQQWMEWYMNGCYSYGPPGPMVKQGQAPPPPPDTPPDETMELRIADHMELAMNPPLPPGDPPKRNNQDLQQCIDGSPPLIYDEDQSSITLTDTLGFYARYYSYQEWKSTRLNKDEIKSKKKQKMVKESQKNKTLAEDKTNHKKDSQDLSNNANGKLASPVEENNQNLNVDSLLDIPLPQANTPKGVSKRRSLLLAKRRSMKLKLKMKHRKSDKPMKTKRHKKLRSESARKKSLKPGEIEDLPICLSD